MSNALELRNVCKTYGDFSIENLSFSLPRGCVMGLVGENGAGKSTTIHMLLGMVKPDSGEVRVLENPLDRNFDQIKQDIGVVLDEPGFPVQLGAKQVDRIMAKTYRNWNSGLFQGYLRRFSLPEKKTVKEYSRGMKMKLGMAVAMSHGAKLLVLDEATAGLDPVIRDEILDILFEFTRDPECSVLMSSHIVSDLEKLCDYVAFLHEGRLLVCEEKDALLERYGLVHLTREQLLNLDGVVLGKKETPYGLEAVVERERVRELPVRPITMEELFVYMIKGGK